MKAYKGLQKNDDGTLWCMDMVYEPGKTYKYDGKIEICERGFHACHELYQVWPYYPNNGKNMFYEVECGGKIIESNDNDGKFVCSEITLVKEIDVSKIAKFDYARSFSEGFAKVGLNGNRNFINKEGNLLSEQWFDDARSFCEGFARVELNGEWNFINTDGRIVSEQWFDIALDFYKGVAGIRCNGRWMEIDKKGKLSEI